MPNVVVKNLFGVAVDVGGVIFDPSESRDIGEIYEGLDLSSEPVLDASSGAELVASFGAALTSGDMSVLSPAVPAGMDPASTIQPASVYSVEANSGVFIFRGEVATPTELPTIASPEDRQYAGVQSTGTLWVYFNNAWRDTEIAASFQDWIPPVGPDPLPQNEGQITLDLSLTKDVAIQQSTGIVYPVGPSFPGYNARGFASQEFIESPGDYFEFPSLVINQHQGFGIASTDDAAGIGPNENGVLIPGSLWTSGIFAYSGRSAMSYFTGVGAWTYGAQNGGSRATGSGYNNAILRAAGLFSTGATVRVGLDEQYRFYTAVLYQGEFRVVFRSENPLPTQQYRFVWAAYFFTSVLSQLPNVVKSPVAPSYRDTHYVNFDGVDEYISFTDSQPIERVLDLTQDWAFGFKLATQWNVEGRDAKLTVLRNGANSFYMRGPGTANAAPYVQNGVLYSGQNTWQTLSSGDRVVVSYQASTQRFSYYRNGNKVGGGWTLRAGLTNESDGTLSIGEGGGWAQYLAGGLDEVFFMPRQMTASEVAESAAGGDPALWTFYGEIIDFLLMGEDTFPQVNGLKGVLAGNLQNGESGDFVEY